jgi:hypothetical protein
MPRKDFHQIFPQGVDYLQQFARYYEWTTAPPAGPWVRLGLPGIACQVLPV